MTLQLQHPCHRRWHSIPRHSLGLKRRIIHVHPSSSMHPGARPAPAPRRRRTEVHTLAPVGFRWWKGTAWDGWDDGTDELPRWSEGLRGHTVRIILKKPIQVVRTSAAKRHRVCVSTPVPKGSAVSKPVANEAPCS